jgi:hypothetical protein
VTAQVGRVPSRPRRASRADQHTLATLALLILLAAAGAFLYHATRETTLWFDEWQWALDRRGDDAGAFLEPHNGHLSLAPVAIYKLLFATAGLDDYGPYRAVVIAAHLLLVSLVFVYARARVGGVVALLAATLIVFLGPGWQDIIWSFQIGYLLSLVGGVGALLALDRGDRVGDLAASVLLALSLSSSGLGVPVALGLTVEVLWGRRRWRDAWIVAAPLALYLLWWVAYQDTDLFGGVLTVPRYIAESAAVTISSLGGLARDTIPREQGTLFAWGPALTVAAVAVLAWRIARLGGVPPRLLTLATIVLSFWALTELGRGAYSAPWEPRYMYVGAVVFVLGAVELARGVSVSWRQGALLAAAVAAAALSNLAVLRDAARFLRTEAQFTRAALGAVEIARPIVEPDHVVGAMPGYPYLIVRAGAYFAMSQELGSPAATPGGLEAEPEAARLRADAELARIHGVAAVESSRRAGAGAAPAVDEVAGGTVARRGSCIEFQPADATLAGESRHLDVTIPPSGVVLTPESGPAALGVRRFAAGFRPVSRVPDSLSVTVRIRPDLSSRPWHLRISPTARTTVCGLA